MIDSRVLTALTGQIRLLPREGNFKILTAFLACMVCGHFIINSKPGGAKIISPLASCCEGEKVATV